MEPEQNREDPESFTASERYFCPFPGCKRSFAELWRLKVHYRAPPDIRGSGKERGHGTELTHCPKCGKGLKPGKHHVGCSGGKTAPRQAKRQRSAAANASLMPDGINGDGQGLYNMAMQNGFGMPNGGMGNGYNQLSTAGYGQQHFTAYPSQQQPVQSDITGSYYQGQAHPMPGGMMQPPIQPQQQTGNFQSPTLGMEPLSSGASAGQQLLHAGSGEMMNSNQQGYQYHQQQMQLPQPMMHMQQPQDMMQQQPHLQQPGVDVMGTHIQQQQPAVMMQPQVKQEVSMMQPAGHATTACGAYLAQQAQQHQQQSQLTVQQGYMGQQAAAAGLMPPPPPVPMAQMQQQQQPGQLIQQASTSSSSMSEPQHQLLPLPPPACAPNQPAQIGQISSNLFDEIDNMAGAAGDTAVQPAASAGSTRAPSPPPLPPDFPQSVGAGNFTLFNFSQFNQKLPAQQGPSQQMAMMPRGMEQELPPSMDDLWAPEATYDHHSDGDLMQLLFGAPEQPPTMATIHLHHFLEDDACSSPLLGGLLGGSMDDLRAAEAKAGTIAVEPAAAIGAAAAAGEVDAAAPATNGMNGLMLPPSAVPAEQQHTQQNQMMMPLKNAVLVKADSPGQLEQQWQQQHQCGLVPGNNGVIAAAQCGSAAAMQMHMQGGTGALVQIKSEDGSCLLQQSAVTSMPEAVASRAT